MKNRKDPFVDDDGWDREALCDIGWDGFADDAKRVFYEIENCRRGCYGFGDTGEDLLNKLLEMKETIGCLAEEMEARLPPQLMKGGSRHANSKKVGRQHD